MKILTCLKKLKEKHSAENRIFSKDLKTWKWNNYKSAVECVLKEVDWWYVKRERCLPAKSNWYIGNTFIWFIVVRNGSRCLCVSLRAITATLLQKAIFFTSFLYFYRFSSICYSFFQRLKHSPDWFRLWNLILRRNTDI